jgi:hypothetical protein
VAPEIPVHGNRNSAEAAMCIIGIVGAPDHALIVIIIIPMQDAGHAHGVRLEGFTVMHFKIHAAVCIDYFLILIL